MKSIVILSGEIALQYMQSTDVVYISWKNGKMKKESVIEMSRREFDRLVLSWLVNTDWADGALK